MSSHRNLYLADLHAPTLERVENASGAALAALKVVEVTGAGTTFPKVDLTDGTDERPWGLVRGQIVQTESSTSFTSSIPDGEEGRIVVIGRVQGVNTFAYALHTALYADASGDLTSTPTGLVVARVTHVDATDGEIYFRVEGPAGPQGPAGPSGTPSGPAGGDLGGTYPNPQVNDLTITSEAQGDILYFNGSNWVRLAAGTSGQVLETQGAGANPSWETSAASVTPVLYEHFVSGNIDTDEIGSYSWKKLTGGTGAALAMTGEAGRPGIASLEAGTAAGARASLYLGGISNVGNFIVSPAPSGNPELYFEWLVKFTGSVGSSDLERFTAGFGVDFESTGGAEHLDGVYVEFDRSLVGQFRLVCAAAGTRTRITGTTAVAVDTWYRVGVRITYPAGVPTAQLVINGANEGASNTANIPTALLGYGIRVDAGATVGTECVCHVDLTRIDQETLGED